jgi:hypothetical protein
MGRGKFYAVPVLAFIVITTATRDVSAATVNWKRVSSTIYPYSISQPSSFRHLVVRETSNLLADYYWPSLGSSITNLNVKATKGSVPKSLAADESLSGKPAKRSGWMLIAGHRSPLMRTDYKALVGQWTVERVTFASHGLVWYVSASYEHQYRSLRPQLLRMMHSFKLVVQTRRH